MSKNVKDDFNKRPFSVSYPPASEASREVENLTGRKNLHPPFLAENNYPDSPHSYLNV